MTTSENSSTAVLDSIAPSTPVSSPHNDLHISETFPTSTSLFPSQTITLPAAAPTFTTTSTILSSSGIPSDIPSFSHGLQLPNLSSLNITTLVTIRFDGTNYRLWRSQIEPVFFTYGVFGIVDGSIACPPSTSPDYSLWLRLDSLVRTWLNATFTSDIVQDIYHYATSREIWLALQERYLDNSKANSHSLRLQLYALRKNNNSMDVYLREIKTIADTLFDIQKPVVEDDLISIALHGLPPEYGTFVTALVNSGEVLSWNIVYRKLLAQESHLKLASQAHATTTYTAYADILLNK